MKCLWSETFRRRIAKGVYYLNASVELADVPGMGQTHSRNHKVFFASTISEIGIVNIAEVPIVTDSGRNFVAAVSDIRSQRCMTRRLHTVLSDSCKSAKNLT